MPSSTENLRLEQRLVAALRHRLRTVRLAPQPPVWFGPTPEEELARQSPFFADGFTPVFNREPPHDMLGFLTVVGKAVPIEPFPPSDLYDPSRLWIPSFIRMLMAAKGRLPVMEFQHALLGSPTPTGGIDLTKPLVPARDLGGLVGPWERAKAAAVARWIEENGRPVFPPAGPPRP